MAKDDKKAPSFQDILNTPASEITRPKPLPVGTYQCVNRTLPRIDKSTKQLTDFAEFTLHPIKIGKDVDEDALEAMGGLDGKTLRATFYITEKAKWRLKEFLEDLGIDPKGKSLGDMINESPNRQVLVKVVHTESPPGSGQVYANVGETGPVD